MDDTKLITDSLLLDRNNPILLPAKALSRAGRSGSPVRKAIHVKKREPISLRVYTSTLNTYEDPDPSIDFRTMRLGDLPTTLVGSVHKEHAILRSASPSRTATTATTARASTSASQRPSKGVPVAPAHAHSTAVSPTKRNLAHYNSTSSDENPMGERPSTARYSQPEVNAEGNGRAKSGRKKGVGPENPHTLSANFRALGHSEGRTFIDNSTSENPGPGHYTVRYALREKRVVETRMDLMGAPVAGRFAMTLPRGERSPTSPNPRSGASHPAHLPDEPAVTGTLDLDGTIAAVQEEEGAASPALEPSGDGAESPGQVLLQNLGEKSFEQGLSPALSPTSPKFKTLQGFNPGRSLPKGGDQQFNGTISFFAPPRTDPTEIALRASAASHLVPYDIDHSLEIVKKRAVTGMAVFDRMLSRETAQKGLPSGTQAPPVGTYQPSQVESYVAWRQVKASIPRAAGSPVVALTRAGIRRAFAESLGDPSASGPEGLSKTAPPGALGGEDSESQWYLDGEVYRRRHMAPGRVEKQVLKTMQRVLVQRERHHLEAAAMHEGLIALEDYHYTPEVPTPIPEAQEEEEQEAVLEVEEEPAEVRAVAVDSPSMEAPEPSRSAWEPSTEDASGPAAEVAAPEVVLETTEEEEPTAEAEPGPIERQPEEGTAALSTPIQEEVALEAAPEAALETATLPAAAGALPPIPSGEVVLAPGHQLGAASIQLGEKPRRSPGKGFTARSQRSFAPTSTVDVQFPALEVGPAQAPLTVSVARLRNIGGPDERLAAVDRLTLKRNNVSPAGVSFTSGAVVHTPVFNIHSSKPTASPPGPPRNLYGPLGLPQLGRFMQEPLDLRDNLFPKKFEGQRKAPKKISTAVRPSLRLTVAEHKEMAVQSGPLKSHVVVKVPNPLLPPEEPSHVEMEEGSTLEAGDM